MLTDVWLTRRVESSLYAKKWRAPLGTGVKKNEMCWARREKEMRCGQIAKYM